MNTRVVALLALAAATILATAPVLADDRDLLRSIVAPPSVYIIYDSGGTQGMDPTMSIPPSPFLDGADDPQSKLTIAKEVLSWFVDEFDFNFGFNFFEKTDLAVNYLNYLYRVPDGAPAMLDGTAPGGLIRMGGNADYVGGDKATEMPQLGPIRYGTRGSECFAVVIAADGSRSYPNIESCAGLPPVSAGARLVVSYLLSSDGQRKRPLDGPHYYPAYDWNTLPGALQLAMTNGYWAGVASSLGIDTTTDVMVWGKQLKELMVHPYDDGGPEDGTLRSRIIDTGGFHIYTVDQIGSLVLTIREESFAASGSAWTPSGTRDTPVEFVRSFVLFEGPVDEIDTPGSYGSKHNILGAVSWQGTGGDCGGIYPPEEIVPLPPYDPTTGEPTADYRDRIKSFLQPQPSGVYYFPNRPGAVDIDFFLPQVRTKRIPYTEAMVAAGRRDFSSSLREAREYILGFRQQSDPLAECRQSYILIITDGDTTCENQANPTCNQAQLCGEANIPVFVIGFGSETRFEDRTAFWCMAQRSRGQAFIAPDAAALKAQLRAVGQVINERRAAFSAPAVPSVELATREKGYISTFFSIDERTIWEGHLRAYEIDPTTGVVPTTCSTDRSGRTLCSPDTGRALWDAGALLAEDYASWASRRLFFAPATGTSVPAARSPFRVEAASEVGLYNQIFTPATPATALTDEQRVELRSVVNFIRGDRASVDRDADTIPDYLFPRERGLNEPASGIAILGDIFHSVPAIAGRPDCFACLVRNYDGYADYFEANHWRRKVLLVGANDGSLHAFDAGFYARDPGYPTQYDGGTGEEMFAWIPNGVMARFDELYLGTVPYYTVDGSPTVADVHIDPFHAGTPTPSEREWRTVVLFGLRSGGSTVTALDITRPDPLTDHDGNPATPPVPQSGRLPACLDGGSGCSGTYPALLWEFADAGIDAAGNPDLAETWSKPSVALVSVQGATGPEKRFAVLFGGGYHASGQGGDHLYMLDVETGRPLVKLPAAGSVAGEVAILDANLDGYAERLYWADTAGSIWRMTLANSTGLLTAVPDASGQVQCTAADANTFTCSSWTVKRLFQPGAAAGRQPLFHRPLIVLVGYNTDGSAIYAIGVGSGDREDILGPNGPTVSPTNPSPNPWHRFYMVLDPVSEGGLPFSELNLAAIDVAAAAAPAGTNYFDPTGTYKGWYLILRDHEKVNTAAVAAQSQLVFSTFTPNPEFRVDDNGYATACFPMGNARTYVVDVFNANSLVDADPATPGIQPSDSRYIDQRSDVLMVSEPILYVGEDGRLHILQTTDNLGIVEPVTPTSVSGSMVLWRER